MTATPFLPTFDNLPTTLPVFPLDNVIIMPGAILPLNIFEQRYLNMIEDALRTHHMFGMVQPDPTLFTDPPTLYQTGCAGRITSYAETADGRILLSLTGVSRFHITQEVDSIRGYRIAVPDWQAFQSDFYADIKLMSPVREEIDTALRLFFEQKEIKFDWNVMNKMSDQQLVHTMATLLPFDSVEKQVILEADDVDQCASALLSALAFAATNPPTFF